MSKSSKTLTAFLEYADLNANQLAKQLDMSRTQSLYDILDDKIAISRKMAEKIKEVYKEVNISWLLTGEGEMLIDGDKTYIEKRRGLKNEKEYIVPFYDAGATAGNKLTNTDTAITDPAGVISVGHFLSDAEAAIRIYGNSMLTGYPPGCILGISQLKERIIQPGEVYVIETEEQRIFKRLFYKNDDPDSDSVLCYSDNTMLFDGGARHGKPAYPPFYVPLKNIRKINVVLGVVKRNTNLLIK